MKRFIERFELRSASEKRNAIGGVVLAVVLLLWCWNSHPLLAGEIMGGIVTAVVLGGLISAYNWLRNHDLEHKLRQSLSLHGLFESICSEKGFPDKTTIIGVQIENKTDVPVVLRQVLFLTRPAGFTISPLLVFNHRFVKMPEAKSLADMVTAGGRGTSTNVFLEMPPSTTTTWGLPMHADLSWKWWTSTAEGQPYSPITGCDIVFEYPKLFGGRGIVKVRSHKYVTAHMKSFFDSKLLGYGLITKEAIQSDNARDDTTAQVAIHVS